MVGDGNTVGVAAEIVEHLFRATEGRLRVDHPVFSEQQAKPGSEGLGLRERSQVSVQVQPAVTEGLPESGHELAAKDATKHVDREEKLRARFYPVRAIEAQPASRNNAMDMRVQTELLIPGVQHTEETDFRAEVPGIASDLEQSFRTAA